LPIVVIAAAKINFDFSRTEVRRLMTRRTTRKQNKLPLMGSHQRCWIWGRQPVIETLRAGRWRPLEVQLDERLPAKERDEAKRRGEELGVEVLFAPASALARLCHSDEHQGFLAKMPPFPYDDAAQLLDARPHRPFYVVLDAVQDPFNFGAILRSADAFGVDGVFVGAARQAEVSSLVVRASSGAVNHVRLAQVKDLAEWISKLKHEGVTVVGTSPNARRDVSQADLRGPTAIILGNEAMGVRAEILDLCDERVAIAQRGRVGSLNAAVAAGILFYEVSRQRGADARDQR
jgi:23S rRNA (guanosine2251-2'-O)-methyltransferase